MGTRHRQLRRLHITTAAEAHAVAGFFHRTGNRPGHAIVAVMNAGGRCIDLQLVDGGGDAVAEVVDLVCALNEGRAVTALVVSDRTGEVPVDRVDDSCTWFAAHAAAADHGVRLLDWLVVSGHFVFSAADHTTIPAGWPATGAVRGA